MAGSSRKWLGLPLIGILLWQCQLGPAQPPGPSRSDTGPQHAGRVHTNALAGSTSPYLLQHAHNPVNWLPWGQAAFDKARREQKPIFVSIGYSTCYWCHVMERESFEDEQVAAILNEHYVAIKVDREQRPDIDEQLMLATQLLTGRGGWPNSVWLTSDGRPWMAGTYFPKAQFMATLETLNRVWRDEAAAVQKQADALSAAIREAVAVQPPDSNSVLDASPLHRALSELEQLFDARYGGFGSQPKFPPHGQLLLLSQLAGESERPRQMLTKTLDAIWCGGIHDHIGGGFHRYSTDQRWFLPHFEKMLYDNAQLMRAYTEAFRVTGLPHYSHAVEDVFGWLQREMTHPEGGFYSAIDSESDGEEGRFYTWSLAELTEVLGDEAELFAKTYQCSIEGNFVEEATGHRPGTNIPYLDLNQFEQQPLELLAPFPEARQRLLTARANREFPHLDDKVITAWNGLMIGSLAYAGRVLDEPKYVAAAERGARFILENLVDPRGQLLRNWRQGQAEGLGYLNDYAFFSQALLELHQATGDERWLNDAEALCSDMLKRFQDPLQGGFFFTSSEHETLLARSKNLTSGGNLPNGNGVAAQVLIDLHAATGNAAYLQTARETVLAFSDLMRKAPRQVEHLVLAGSRLQSRESDSPAANQTAPQAVQRAPAVTARLFHPTAPVSVGEKLMARIELDIADGFHLYGPSEGDGDSLVQSVEIELVEQKGLQAGELIRPAGQRKQDPVLGRPLTIYSGSLRFQVPIQLSADVVESQLPIVLRITYQACDSRMCLQPQTVELRSMLRVAQ